MLNNYPLMFCFVGEQPISNLIPIKCLNPDSVVLCVTERTENIGNSLNSAIGNRGSIEKVDPYNIAEILNTLTAALKKKNNIDVPKAAFNLTGGTKPMVFAGLLICQKYKFPFCYLQSEGGKSILYTYCWENGEPALHKHKELPATINLVEYIKIHVGDKYKFKNDAEKYEELVFNCLQDQVDEIMKNVYLTDSLEVDLIFRISNQVGIAEVKTKNKARTKDGIDHLNTAGAREYLGTYTKKFYIADREYPENNKALATERNITVIELKNSENTGDLRELDKEDQKLLVNTILKEMQR